MTSLAFSTKELKIKVYNLDEFTKFPSKQGLLITRINNPADRGMAFDSALADFLISFTAGVSATIVAEYLINLLKSQRDDYQRTSIFIDNRSINLKDISDEELEMKVESIVKKIQEKQNIE